MVRIQNLMFHRHVAKYYGAGEEGIADGRDEDPTFFFTAPDSAHLGKKNCGSDLKSKLRKK